MKLKNKLFVMCVIPILGMGIIFMLEMNLYLKTTKSMDDVNLVQTELQTILNGDRDGYQAFLAVVNATQSLDPKYIQKQIDSSNENSGQVWERISGPAKNFTAEMKPIYKTFVDNFNKWKEFDQLILEKVVSTASINDKRGAISERSIEHFQKMRNTIDLLGEQIDKKLQTNIPLKRRIALERALSSVLNSDRDAYQAYVAQILALNEKNYDKLKEYDESSKENIKQTTERLNEGASALGAEATDLQSTFNENFEKWSTSSREVLTLTLQVYEENATILNTLPLSEKSFELMRNAIDKIGELQIERSEKEIEASKVNGRYMLSLVLAISITLVVITLSLGFFIIRTILKQLGGEPADMEGIAKKIAIGQFDIVQSDQKATGIFAELLKMSISLKAAIKSIQDTMKGVSQGDFTVKIDDEGMNGELVLIKDSINSSIDMLSNTINEVIATAEQVNKGSDQLSSSAQVLSSGTTEQAASLEEISSSMHEVEIRAKTNHESAIQASQLSSQTLGIVDRGNTQMKEMLSSMDKISRTSSEISKINKVIDEIAFQTNLLALNAAVEAARAGKYGKGFAVVADEVRSLAARSAKAAKNTTELIENSLKEVGNGVENAAKTAEILNEIDNSISKFNDLVVEITAASQEQSAGSKEMNNALSQVNNVVQQNSFISEQTASASEELNEQASQLQKYMSYFKINQTVKNHGSKPTQHSIIQPKLSVDKSVHASKMITLEEDTFRKN